MIKVTCSRAWKNLPLIGLSLLLLATAGAGAIGLMSWSAATITALLGSFALCAAIFTFTYLHEDKQSKTLRNKHPDEPWLWDTRWQSDHIPSRSLWDLSGSLFIAVIVTLLALPMFVIIPRELASGNFFALLGFVPIVAALYLGWYAYRSWHANRFERNMSLYLDSRPARLGATFAARLTIPSVVHIRSAMVTLEHLRIRAIQESDGTSFEKRVEHTAEAKIESHLDSEGQRIFSILIDVPANARPTSWATEKAESYWDLVVTLDIKSRIVSVRYEVPVAESNQ